MVTSKEAIVSVIEKYKEEVRKIPEVERVYGVNSGWLYHIETVVTNPEDVDLNVVLKAQEYIKEEHKRMKKENNLPMFSEILGFSIWDVSGSDKRIKMLRESGIECGDRDVIYERR